MHLREQIKIFFSSFVWCNIIVPSRQTSCFFIALEFTCEFKNRESKKNSLNRRPSLRYQKHEVCPWGIVSFAYYLKLGKFLIYVAIITHHFLKKIFIIIGKQVYNQIDAIIINYANIISFIQKITNAFII